MSGFLVVDQSVTRQSLCFLVSFRITASNLYIASSVISGVGELSLDRSDQKMENESVVSPEPTVCPYLLLDVRDRDQYNCCHIISGTRRTPAAVGQKESSARNNSERLSPTAHSFPVALLSRTMNPDTRVQEYVSLNTNYFSQTQLGPQALSTELNP